MKSWHKLLEWSKCHVGLLRRLVQAEEAWMRPRPASIGISPLTGEFGRLALAWPSPGIPLSSVYQNPRFLRCRYENKTQGGSCVVEDQRSAHFPGTRPITHTKRLKDGKSGNENRPHELARDLQPSQRCPECGSTRLFKDGIRYLSDGAKVQRWLCRDCGHRFSLTASQNGFASETKNVEILNILHNKKIHCQVCELLTEGPKNLDTTVETKTTAGEKPLQQDINGLIVRFMAWLEKEGYGKETRYPYNLKRLIGLGANLLSPESVKETIGRHNVKNGSKLQHVYAYSAFCKMLKMTWDPPHYRQEETLPFVPDESELNALIYASRSKRMTAFLQVLKEIWVDPGEALGLRWIDVSGNTVTVNRPVKGHNPRQLPISNKLLAMLNELPKTSERIFPVTYRTMFSCYSKVRKRAAFLQKNPRLLSIEFRSFRHWGGTMLVYYTNGNLLTVKRLLGHKRIENTMKYIGLIPNFKEGEFEVVTATTDEEIKKIGGAGFSKFDERKIGETVISYYRRPKRFSADG
jgi:integrase